MGVYKTVSKMFNNNPRCTLLDSIPKRKLKKKHLFVNFDFLTTMLSMNSFNNGLVNNTPVSVSNNFSPFKVGGSTILGNVFKFIKNNNETEPNSKPTLENILNNYGSNENSVKKIVEFSPFLFSREEFDNQTQNIRENNNLEFSDAFNTSVENTTNQNLFNNQNQMNNLLNEYNNSDITTAINNQNKEILMDNDLDVNENEELLNDLNMSDQNEFDLNNEDEEETNNEEETEEEEETEVEEENPVEEEEEEETEVEEENPVEEETEVEEENNNEENPVEEETNNEEGSNNEENPVEEETNK